MDDFYLENVKEWQQLPVTKTLILILKAYKYETQCKYIQSLSIDQFQYLRGLEIGYDRAIQVIEEEIKNQVSINIEQVPVIVK